MSICIALAQVLQDEFKKQEERKMELEEKIDLMEKNIKEGFLHYTREIMKGLDDANQALMDTILDTIAPPLHTIPPPQLARRSSPVSILDIAENKNEIQNLFFLSLFSCSSCSSQNAS
jgi:hypothetical protein